jgi:FkbM family methyltransferase
MRIVFESIKKIGLKNTVYKIIRHALLISQIEKALLKGLKIKFVRSHYGILMRANWDDTTFNSCYFGTYGKILSDYLSSISEEFIFIDIGANQGLYSILASKNTNCCRTIAFEPVPTTFAFLEDNIKANKSEGCIIPICAALSSENGFAEISMNKGHSGSASLKNHITNPNTAIEEIRLVNSTEIDNKIDVECSIIIKIDVEGYEDVVINELVNSKYFSRVMSIFYEVDEDWIEPRVIEEKLRKLDFNDFQKIGEGKHYDVLAQRAVFQD